MDLSISFRFFSRGTIQLIALTRLIFERRKYARSEAESGIYWTMMSLPCLVFFYLVNRKYSLYMVYCYKLGVLSDRYK